MVQMQVTICKHFQELNKVTTARKVSTSKRNSTTAESDLETVIMDKKKGHYLKKKWRRENGPRFFFWISRNKEMHNILASWRYY